MNAVVEFPMLNTFGPMTQLCVEVDRSLGAIYSLMNPTPRPCFNVALLNEIQRTEDAIKETEGWILHKGEPMQVNFVVYGSKNPDVFNLGGDLSLFMRCIEHKDRDTLLNYAQLCIRNIYPRITNFNLPITTISVLQGRALGGGFECALASSVLIAERQATMGLPEVLFNLFPGMGALSLLSRKIGMRKAEQMILSGRIYTAEEMYELGVVDLLTEEGSGMDAARSYMRNHSKHLNSFQALQLAKQLCQPIEEIELLRIVDVWVDAALRLEQKDLRMMARLVRAQDRLRDLESSDDTAEVILNTPLCLLAS